MPPPAMHKLRDQGGDIASFLKICFHLNVKFETPDKTLKPVAIGPFAALQLVPLPDLADLRHDFVETAAVIQPLKAYAAIGVHG